MANEENPKQKRPKPSGWKPKHRKGYVMPSQRPEANRKRFAKWKARKDAELKTNDWFDQSVGLKRYVTGVQKELRSALTMLEDKRLTLMEEAIDYADKGDYILCRTSLREANDVYKEELRIDKYLQSISFQRLNNSDLLAALRQVSRMASNKAKEYMKDIDKAVLPLIISKKDEMLPEHAIEYADMIQRDLDGFSFNNDVAEFIYDIYQRRVDVGGSIPEQILKTGSEGHGESLEKAES